MMNFIFGVATGVAIVLSYDLGVELWAYINQVREQKKNEPPRT
jgi:hypothetical protein